MKQIKIQKTYDELYELAFKDSVTGAYSRNMLEELRKYIDKQAVYVTFVDVNNLKFINDNYGHKTGDEALKYVANKLMTVSEYVFRLGGDEFLVIHDAPVTMPFTRSAHGTVYKPCDMSLAKAMHLADIEMYADKKNKIIYR